MQRSTARRCDTDKNLGCEWYRGRDNQRTAQLTNAVAIAAGEVHTLALTKEGRVIAWGNNSYGQTNVPAGLSNVVAVSVAGSNNLALTADGTVVGWGGNIFCPTNTVPPGLTNMIAIAGGGVGFALKTDGVVVSWLCDGSDYTDSPHVGQSNIAAIATGNYGTAALTTDGQVVGRSFQYFDAPPSDLSNVVSIALGYFQGLALREDGRVVSWGREFQTNVPPDLDEVVAIAAGAVRNAALEKNGRLITWPSQYSPGWQSNVLYQGTNVIGIAVGKYHTVALLDSDDSQLSWRLPVPRIVTNGVAIDIPAQLGATYAIEYKTSLIETGWKLKQLIVGQGKLQQISAPAESQGYYRARRVR